MIEPKKNIYVTTTAQIQEIKTLSGLRGLAAMIVVVSHSANSGMVPALFGSGYGKTGVMLFFVLSGFLMTYLYAEKQINQTNLVKYCFARIGRVFPLYYFLIIISIIISIMSGGETFFPYILDVKTAALSLAIIKAPHVFWTIPVEIHFYFVFALFWLTNKRYGLSTAVVLLIILASVPIAVIHLLLHRMPVMLTSYMFCFVFGVFIALMYDRIHHGEFVKRVFDHSGLPLLIMLLLNLPFVKEQYFPSSASTFIRIWADPITWFLILSVMVCAINESRSLSILRTPPALFLGNVSFGIYLYHSPVIFYFTEMTSFAPLLKFAMAIAVTLIIATLSFKLFEKPANNAIQARGLTLSR